MAFIIVLFIGFDSLISFGYAVAGNNTEMTGNESDLGIAAEASMQAIGTAFMCILGF